MASARVSWLELDHMLTPKSIPGSGYHLGLELCFSVGGNTVSLFLKAMSGDIFGFCNIVCVCVCVCVCVRERERERARERDATSMLHIRGPGMLLNIL
jgi:hypothetical protein